MLHVSYGLSCVASFVFVLFCVLFRVFCFDSFGLFWLVGFVVFGLIALFSLCLPVVLVASLLFGVCLMFGSCCFSCVV